MARKIIQHISKYWIIYAELVFGLIALIISEHLPKESFWHFLIAEVAIALWVAALLTLTFEPQTRNEIYHTLEDVAQRTQEKNQGALAGLVGNAVSGLEDTQKQTKTALETVVNDAVSGLEDTQRQTKTALEATVKSAVDEVKKSTVDHMLSELCGNENIYKEIKTYVFDKTFVRKDFDIKLTLS